MGKNRKKLLSYLYLLSLVFNLLLPLVKPIQALAHTRRAHIDRNSHLYIRGAFHRYNTGRANRHATPKFDEHGNLLFCIEPTIPVHSHVKYRVSDVPREEKYLRASLVAYHGYEQQKSPKNYAYATWYIQELISGQYITEVRGGGLSYDEYHAFRRAIDPKINAFFTLPSFANQSITLREGESVTLTDWNNSLPYYNISSDHQGLEISKHGNQLTLKANQGSVNNPSLTFSYDVDSSHQGTPLLFQHPNSQDLLLARVRDPNYFDLDINVIKKGWVQVFKHDKEDNSTPIAGAEFEVLDEGGRVVSRLRTGPNGSAITGALPGNQWYTVRETKAAYPYVIDRTPHKEKH